LRSRLEITAWRARERDLKDAPRRGRTDSPRTRHHAPGGETSGLNRAGDERIAEWCRADAVRRRLRRLHGRPPTGRRG